MHVIRSHDALFRFVFGEPEQMGELLRGNLPPAVVAAIDWSSLRQVDGTFVDAELQERHADLLFEARLGDRELVDLDGLSAEVATFVRGLQPDLCILLDDLAVATEADLDARAMSATADLSLRFLQFLRQRRFATAAQDIPRWQELLRRLLDLPRGRMVLFALVSWFLQRAPDGEQVLRTVMARIRDSDTRQTMKSALDQLLDRGREEGVLQGQREFLRRLLETRFGDLSQDVRSRVAIGSHDELAAWGRKILTAASLEQIFDAG